MLQENFWQQKSLSAMTQQEWEAICDGCGKCCLNSFIDSDEEDDEFSPTDTSTVLPVCVLIMQTASNSFQVA